MKDENGNVSEKSDEKPRLCGAKTRAGAPCAKIGLANGRCRQHGGLSTGPRLKHGQRASKNGPARRRLSERADKFERMTDPLNLSRELAFLRAIFEEWLEENDAKTLDTAARAEALTVVSETGKLIERAERIRNATALTQAEVKYLTVRIAGLMVKYVPDKALRDAFRAELKEATGVQTDTGPARALPEGDDA